MESTAYPRDLLGYGRTTPDPQWPDRARLALQFVINYEEGGEHSIMDGDDCSEAFVTEEPAVPFPQRRNMNVESQYEYGSRAGFWRLHRLFTERGIPVTVFGVTLALKRNHEAVAAKLEGGWEIASHGYRWIDYSGLAEDDERRYLRLAVEGHAEATGEAPLGWYTGRWSPNSRKLIAEFPNFLYHSDCFSDDLPFWATVGDRHQLVIPYTLDNNDVRYVTPYGFNSESFFAYLRDAFDLLYREGSAHPKMMNVGLHCRISGRPGRACDLERFLDYVSNREGVWICRRAEIARHWHDNLPT
jgi:putative urate catabolism protein